MNGNTYVLRNKSGEEQGRVYCHSFRSRGAVGRRLWIRKEEFPAELQEVIELHRGGLEEVTFSPKDGSISNRELKVLGLSLDLQSAVAEQRANAPRANSGSSQKSNREEMLLALLELGLTADHLEELTRLQEELNEARKAAADNFFEETINANNASDAEKEFFERFLQ